ncbi:hypothetical protein CP8484711_0480 [Chlamydia psittaci 84-8471/1]|nr:hypothetical protein CP8484711_0480 [Chlamydia psittaci 84-8471/1]
MRFNASTNVPDSTSESLPLMGKRFPSFSVLSEQPQEL